MIDAINFILSRYYMKLTKLQRDYEQEKDLTHTEEGAEELKKQLIEIEVYQKIIWDMENIKTELLSFLK